MSLCPINTTPTKKTYQVNTTPTGKGSYGSVHRGSDTVTGSPVAVKIHAGQESLHLKARQESVFLTKVTGIPHALRLRAVAGEAQRLFIVTDLIPSSDVGKSFLYGKGAQQLTWSEIVTIIKQSLECLEALHKAGIVHGDLKINNVIFEREARYLTLIDFGEAGDITKPAGSYKPAFAYVAPEVILDGLPGFAIDIWCLGCLVFTLVTKGRLFPVNLKGDLKGSCNTLLQLMREQIGSPSHAFLKSCKKVADFFVKDTADQFSLKQGTLPPLLNSWKERMLEAQKKYGFPLEEVNLLIQMMEKIVCYENRATASELLQSPLFDNDICFKLKVPNDTGLKGSIRIYRAVDQQENPYIQIDLPEKVKRSCCHILKDPGQKYVLKVELAGKMAVSKKLKLKSQDTIEIQNLNGSLSVRKAKKARSKKTSRSDATPFSPLKARVLMKGLVTTPSKSLGKVLGKRKDRDVEPSLVEKTVVLPNVF